MPKLRDYQEEDVALVLAAHQDHQVVLGRAATGLGKAVELAALAQHYSPTGRVMILVDNKKLVRQLAETVRWFTGNRPGIEMAEERAINDDTFCPPDQIVVSTVQTQYSGPEGYERYRRFNPADWSCILLDETELFLAAKSRSVVEWYRQNPKTRIYGTTATPCRTDGVAMANLFETVAFNRDIRWGINNGWLVKMKQAFVTVSVDFSTLQVRKDEGGESDYSDEEIASRIENEQTQIELAKGIVHVTEDRKSIIFCPTVKIAQAVAHYIDAEKPGSARVIYGEMTDQQKDDTFSAFADNQFQYLSSVMLCAKGFDQPDIRAVVNCRKTRSKRLFQQMVGRGSRPLKGLLDGIESPAERIKAIAASKKSECLLVNMVGVEREVRDCTIIDILGEAEPEVLERAKKIAEETECDTDEAIELAQVEVDELQEAERLIAEAEGEGMQAQDEWELRRRVSVEANIEVQYEDGLGGEGHVEQKSGPNDRQIAILRKAKVPESTIASLGAAGVKSLCQKILQRYREGLCSYAQGSVLQRSGYSKDEIAGMSRERASAAIEACKNNGWKRAA